MKSLEVTKSVEEMKAFYDEAWQKAPHSFEGFDGCNGYKEQHQIRRFNETLKRLDLHITPESNVLELGCGNGLMTREIAKRCHMVEAVDISQEAIARCPASYNIIYYCDDVIHFLQSRHRYGSRGLAEYDIIIACELLEHMPDLALFLKLVFNEKAYTLFSFPIGEPFNTIGSFDNSLYGHETRPGDATGHVHFEIKEDEISCCFGKLTDYWTNGINVILGGYGKEGCNG